MSDEILDIVQEQEIHLKASDSSASGIDAATSDTSPLDTDIIVGARIGWLKWTLATIKSYFKTYFDTIYQVIFVSGSNIKTVNGESLLGSGDITIEGGATLPATTAILKGDGAGGASEAVPEGDYELPFDLDASEVWTKLTHYTVGDVVFIYNQNSIIFYRCKNEHTSGGTIINPDIVANWRLVGYYGDPRVTGVSGLVKSDGAGNIGAATPGVDFAPVWNFDANGWEPDRFYNIGDQVGFEPGNGTVYGLYCITEHISTGSSPLDDVGKWLIIHYHAFTIEDDPVFSAWLSTTPPAYPGDIPDITYPNIQDAINIESFTDWQSGASYVVGDKKRGLLELANTWWYAECNTPHIATGTVPFDVEYEKWNVITKIPVTAGLLDETSHDLLDHSGLTGIHAQNTDTGTTGASFTVDSDSTTGKIEITAVAGAANKKLTLQNEALTGDHTLTLPNKTGTVAVTSDIGAAFPGFGTDHATAAYGDHTHAALHTQGTDTGTTGADFTVDSDSTTGKIKISAVAGAADKTLTVQNEALTDNRTLTLPNKTGTVAVTTDIPTVSGLLSNVVEDTTPQLGGDLDVNGKSTDWGAIISTNSTYKGDTLTVTVDTNSVGFGAALAQGADFHFDEADADAITNCYLIVLALETGTGTKKVLLPGGQICNTGWSWSAGPVYLSTTQGTLTQTAPTGTDDVTVIIGWALSATVVLFNPYASFIEHT